MKQIANIQYITQDHPSLSHAEQARLMYKNGINWVQLRMKNATKEEFIAEAEKAMAYAREFGGILLINDHVDICQTVGAHGVHVGLSDMPIAEVRSVLGDEAIIGGTANTIDDIEWHVKNGADYVGLGPFRFTTTKKNLSPIIGLEGYKKLVEEMKERNITIPVVAVGGITMNDIAEIQATGLYGVAISSALLKSLTPTLSRGEGA